MKMEEQATQEELDLTALYFHFKEAWRNVFIAKIGNDYFIYRALGRQEYYDILEAPQLNDLLKEEAICNACLLWPENYDFALCDAGIPSKLKEHILKNSYLDSFSARKPILNKYRDDMHILDNQITAIICEAYKNLDIEEVEQWDVEKTMKYFSRAEWTLHNIHGIPFQDPGVEEAEAQQYAEQASAAQEESAQTSRRRPRRPPPKPKSTAPAETESKAVEEQEQVTKTKSGRRIKRTIRGGSSADKLTPEKMRELREKYPSIQWENDVIQNEGFEGMKQGDVDTMPALRVGW